MEKAELEDKLALLEQYKTLMDRLAKQDESLRAELEEHMRARDTLQRIDGMKKGAEMLVPVGANCFVYASVKNAKKVICSVGAGVAVEDSVKKAVERLDETIGELNEAGQKLAERVQEMDGKARELAAEVDQAYQQMTRKQ
jgi:prefoldin alpha subunit